MRTYRTNRGPFATRPHYKLAEIDRICGDALNTAGLMPESPEAVRIDRFVEKPLHGPLRRVQRGGDGSTVHIEGPVDRRHGHGQRDQGYRQAHRHQRLVAVVAPVRCGGGQHRPAAAQSRLRPPWRVRCTPG